MTQQPEAISLLGKPLLAADAQQGQDVARLEQLLAEAQADAAAHPDDVQKHMMHGIRLDALHRYRDAIDVYTQGIEKWPDEAMLYKHRGHRYLNLRRFDEAFADLSRANEMRPGTFDMLYHLGLIHYMRGDFEQALTTFQQCHAVTSDDGDIPPTSALRLVAPAAILRIGNVDWLYMTLSRLGRLEEAAAMLDEIDPDLPAGGNMIFYLTRVRFYKGLLTEAETVARFQELGSNSYSMMYGLGNWHLVRGNREQAEHYFREALKASSWPSFAYIAAEVELAQAK